MRMQPCAAACTEGTVLQHDMLTLPACTADLLQQVLAAGTSVIHVTA